MFIETERLILRPLAASDLEAQHLIWNQHDVYRHITGKPMDRETVWLRLLRDIGHWQVFGFGNWSVRLKDTDQHIGVVGVFDYKRAITPPLEAPEAGWVFDAGFHGKGYASEALTAVLTQADTVLNMPRLQCMISYENDASLKLALKCGFKPLRESVFHGETIGILERVRP